MLIEELHPDPNPAKPGPVGYHSTEQANRLLKN